MKITVTQEHIDKGITCSCEACPIALALQDAGFWKCVVGPDSVQLDWGKVGNTRFPLEARKFIRDFDGGYTVSPFTFELEVTN